MIMPKDHMSDCVVIGWLFERTSGAEYRNGVMLLRM